MDDLLTTRQVQDLLKVDRITVYRMLQDGRLKGIKIGQQWRFLTSDVQRLLSPDAHTPMPQALAPTRRFPTHCAQVIQDLYAGLGKIGALVIDTTGAPLTENSRPCALCSLVQSTPAGRSACEAFWKECAAGAKPGWGTCPAGLRYQVTPICENGQVTAYLLSGQVFFSAKEPDPHRLAAAYGLDEAEVTEAAQCAPVLNREQRAEAETWPEKFTQAIESILNERAALVNRLQKIAELSMESEA